VTLDQLFIDAGEQIDRLIDDHLVTQPITPAHPQRARRRIGAIAAAVLVVISAVGLTAVLARREPTSPAQSATPSLFDNGVGLIVFLRHGATNEWANLVRQELLQHGDVLDTSRIEYLDAGRSLALARRVLANDPASLAQVEPDMPTMFRLYAKPQVSQAQLAALGRQLMSMPNVIGASVSDPSSPEGRWVNCDPSPCPANPTGQIPSAPTATVASP
jgi:hypothetical protein